MRSFASEALSTGVVAGAGTAAKLRDEARHLALLDLSRCLWSGAPVAGGGRR